MILFKLQNVAILSILLLSIVYMITYVKKAGVVVEEAGSRLHLLSQYRIQKSVIYTK